MKKSDFPKYEESPFEAKGLTVIRRDTSATKQLVHETGEVITLSEVDDELKVLDPLPYIKFYAEGAKLLPFLGKRGMCVLCYVLSSLKPGRRDIDMHYVDVIEEYPSLKGDGYYKGVAELMQYGFIAMKKGRGHKFWINMNMFFNGDRRRSRKVRKDKILVP